MSDEFIDLKPAFLAELRQRKERAAWNHIRRYVFMGAAGGFLIGLIVAALIYHFTR